MGDLFFQRLGNMNTNGAEAESFFFAGQRKCAWVRRLLKAFDERVFFVNPYFTKIYEAGCAAYEAFCAINIRYYLVKFAMSFLYSIHFNST